VIKLHFDELYSPYIKHLTIRAHNQKLSRIVLQRSEVGGEKRLNAVNGGGGFTRHYLVV
jgi:hypothetical protein